MRAQKCSSEAIEDPRLELVFHMFRSNGRATLLNPPRAKESVWAPPALHTTSSIWPESLIVTVKPLHSKYICYETASLKTL